MRGGAQADDLGSERNGLFVAIVGDVMKGDVNRHETFASLGRVTAGTIPFLGKKSRGKRNAVRGGGHRPPPHRKIISPTPPRWGRGRRWVGRAGSGRGGRLRGPPRRVFP